MDERETWKAFQMKLLDEIHERDPEQITYKLMVKAKPSYVDSDNQRIWCREEREGIWGKVSFS